jgi:gluconate 5-dehydrogenase
MSGSAALFDLKGRIALITGAARGLGESMARALASAGAHVVLNDIDAAALEKARTVFTGQGHAVETSCFDVTDGAAVREGVAAIAARHGHLDILVNNAGIAVYKSAADHEDAEWDRVLDVNLTALHRVAREAAGAMKDSRGGRIINIASVLGLLSRPGVASYVVSKHGVVGLTRVLAGELGPRGITCNAIAPGYVETEMSETLMADRAFHTMIAERTPMKRWAAASELAGPVVFLASPAASYVNGHVLVVDGGMTSCVY